MIEKIIEQVVTQGPFAALFVWLLLYVIKRADEREATLQAESIAREERIMQDALAREERLLGVINGQQGSLDKLAQDQSKIRDDLDDVKQTIHGRVGA